jgi:hypothetical protein
MIKMNDKDYFQIGKKAILEASEAQLIVMEGAKDFCMTTRYNSPHIFELALRRIGEDDLADKFIDPNSDKKTLVERESSIEGILTAILTNIERDNREYAADLESLQRGEFYMPEAGYVDPHFKTPMKPWEEKKEALRQGILEKGLRQGVGSSFNKKYFERCKEDPNFKNTGRIPVIFDGTKDDNGFNVGYPSLTETIYAIYANLALGNKDHVRQVLKDIINVYTQADSKLLVEGFCPPTRSSYDNTASVLRALGLAGDKDASKKFAEQEGKLMASWKEGLGKDNSRYNPEGNIALAFALDYFGKNKGLMGVKNELAKLSLKATTNVEYGHQNRRVCRIGLALTGLEKGKPNFYYTP